MTTNKTALATVPAQTTTIAHDLGPQSLGDVRALANEVAKSKLFGVPSAEAALCIMLTGHELGLTVMQSLRTIHTIENKPVLSADLVVALCRSHPDCEYFRLKSCDTKSATWVTKRKSEPEPLEMSFTWEDATRAELTGKQNWKRYPADMLKARAAVRLGRAVYQDRLMGLYLADELEPSALPAQAPSVRVVQPDNRKVISPEARARSEAYAESHYGEVAADEVAIIEAMLRRIDAAESPKDLQAIGKEIGEHKAEYSADALQRFKVAIKRMQDEFKAIDAERQQMAKPEPVDASLESPAPPQVEETTG